MKTLDLHNVDKWNTSFEIEKFITDNLDSLPIKIITGNSYHNIEEVKGVAKRHSLSTHKDRWINNGAWIIG
tara:strand:+ start:401 stop:613 length:213 start_codon:yes stop_codon:yes gene_type:complete